MLGNLCVALPMIGNPISRDQCAVNMDAYPAAESTAIGLPVRADLIDDCAILKVQAHCPFVMERISIEELSTGHGVGETREVSKR